MWAIIVNEKIVKTFEEYEEALTELFNLFFDGADATIRKIEKDIDN